MDPFLNFSDKVVLITGAARGFGKILAQELASRGAKLVIGDVDEVGIKTVADELSSSGAGVIGLRCDVSSSAECKAMVDAAINNFGQLDIAVNNAGISHDMSPLHLVDEATMDKQFAVNVKGVQFGMSHQIKHMLNQGHGRILNVSSMAGLFGAPMIGAYAAAKHAVIGLTKTAAVEYAKKDILVNAVCPFFSLTNMVTDMADEETQAHFSRGAPMKRLSQPEEVVAMMLMMVSPANTYMTGQCIAIDGGVSAI